MDRYLYIYDKGDTVIAKGNFPYPRSGFPATVEDSHDIGGEPLYSIIRESDKHQVVLRLYHRHLFPARIHMNERIRNG